MLSFKMMTPIALIATLCVAGCSKPSGGPLPSPQPEANNSAPAGEHAHGAGPNGGVIFDLGSHHAEFTVDHGKQQASISILGDDEKTPQAIAATEFILSIKETKTADGTVVAPMAVVMTPVDATDGAASRFVGSDSGIGNVADFEGTLSGEIAGKPAMGEFKE